jgi:hypothetical protein
MSSALKHPCDEEFIRSTRAEAPCALAPDPGQLFAARAVQGVGGALLVPNSLAIIGASSDEERRGRVLEGGHRRSGGRRLSGRGRGCVGSVRAAGGTC